MLKIYILILSIVLISFNSSDGQKIKFVELKSNCFAIDGKPWIPIEINCMLRDTVGSDSSFVLQKYDDLFKVFSLNGGKSIRLWMGREGFFDPTRYEDTSLGNKGLRYFEVLVELAHKYNLHLKVCLEVARNFGGKGAFHKDKYSNKEGGTLLAFRDYLDSQEGRELYLRKASYFSSKFKNNPTIYCWELWNEINTISEGDWRSFSTFMLKAFKQMFPNQLVTVSLGSLDSKWQRDCYKDYLTFVDNDICLIHRYLDMGSEFYACREDIDLSVKNAIEIVDSLGNKNRPIFFNEIGAVKPNHSGDSPLYKIDTLGILMHEMIFSPFFIGAVGPGSLWHYWSYIDPNNLWYHYKMFLNAVAGINPLVEQFEPFNLSISGVRFWGLKGKKNIIVWCKNVNSGFKTELLDKRAPNPTTPFFLSLKKIFPQLIKSKSNIVKYYNPWRNTNSILKINNRGKIYIPEIERTIVITVGL